MMDESPIHHSPRRLPPLTAFAPSPHYEARNSAEIPMQISGFCRADRVAWMMRVREGVGCLAARFGRIIVIGRHREGMIIIDGEAMKMSVAICDVHRFCIVGGACGWCELKFTLQGPR